MDPTHLAYLDPGSAGMLLQVAVGAVAALFLSIKLFWRRILRVLHLTKDTTSPHDPR